jgi:hypothetical protein
MQQTVLTDHGKDIMTEWIPHPPYTELNSPFCYNRNTMNFPEMSETALL